MKSAVLRSLVPMVLLLWTGTPAFAQSATQFSNFICQIDLSVLQPPFTLPDGTSSLFTFDSTRLCTGVASARNVKLTCQDVVPNWPQGTSASTKNFVCTINGETCNVAPMAGDQSAPQLTATDQNLTVDTTGHAQLTCFFKPP